MARRIPLSVLDLSPVPSGSTAGDALRNTIDLARHAEAIGLQRYWLAEHHNAKGLACPVPAVMIGQVAAATSRIRVGSGGVMLPNHSPLTVAETFRVLSALFPGRIDLGLGRAPGTDARTAIALRRSRQALAVDDFPVELAELRAYLADDDAPRGPFPTSIVAAPATRDAPELFLLGSSDVGARLAAELGLGFAFAHHINPPDAVVMLRAYRDAFRPARDGAEPHAILAASAVCAGSPAEAEDLRASLDLAGVRFFQGLRDLPFPSVDEARAHRFDAEEDALRGMSRGRHFVGTADEVAASLLELVDAAGADELMVMTHAHDHEARKRSYTLLQERLGTPE